MIMLLFVFSLINFFHYIDHVGKNANARVLIKIEFSRAMMPWRVLFVFMRISTF